MTPQEIDELKHLKNQNEILLEKLNGLQYKLQIRECEEILNPVGPGVAGPASGPDSVPVPVVSRVSDLNLDALKNSYGEAVQRDLRLQRALLKQEIQLKNAYSQHIKYCGEIQYLSELALAMRDYLPARDAARESSQEVEKYRNEYLNQFVGSQFGPVLYDLQTTYSPEEESAE